MQKCKFKNKLSSFALYTIKKRLQRYSSVIYFNLNLNLSIFGGLYIFALFLSCT